MLDLPLAYVKGKDAESKEAQEYANSSSLAPPLRISKTFRLHSLVRK